MSMPRNARELLTIPAILSKMHVFRPNLSESGAQTVVTMMLNTDIMTVKNAADEGKRAERMLTPIAFKISMRSLASLGRHGVCGKDEEVSG